MEKSYLQVPELSSLLGGITPHAVYKILKSKNLSSTMINPRKKVIPPASVRRILEDRGFKYQKQILTFDMIKGGVGKTTLSSTVAARASHYGCRTLMIDFDLQGNLTRSFDIGLKNPPVWINIIKDNVPITDAIVKIDDFLHIIPSNLSNSRLEIEMQQASINIKDHVADIIEPIIDDYDLIVIDCPPAINKVSAAAICVADLVVIPLNPDPYAMDGLEMTLSEITRIKKSFKITKPDYCIVWNKYDARRRLATTYMHDLAQNISVDHILPVVIRVDSSYENAIASALSIFSSPRTSNAKEDRVFCVSCGSKSDQLIAA